MSDNQCDEKKTPNVYKKLPRNYFTTKIKDFDTFKKFPKNVRKLGKLIVVDKLPKVQ